MFFKELCSYDATQNRKLDVWRSVRQCYKAVKDPKLLQEEFPDTHVGVILLMIIKQVRGQNHFYYILDSGRLRRTKLRLEGFGPLKRK